jgi:hypothetical protein
MLIKLLLYMLHNIYFYMLNELVIIFSLFMFSLENMTRYMLQLKLRLAHWRLVDLITIQYLTPQVVTILLGLD